jgi:DNA-binding PadR family transcriptional regulator
MMDGWRAGEKEFLIHLALNGPSDQGTISKATELSPSTINVAKDGLREKGYIELAERRPRGRGAPRKIFALTPLGLLAALVAGGLWDRLDDALRHWGEISPVFLKRFKVLREWGFEDYVKDFSRRFLVEERALGVLGRYREFLKAYRVEDGFVYSTDEMEGAEEAWFWAGAISRMNHQFYEHILKIGVESVKMEDFIELLKIDEDLRKGWFDWFKLKEKQFKKIKEYERILSDKQ